jgi:ribosomal protein S12 methylthiotransferase accessory factor
VASILDRAECSVADRSSAAATLGLLWVDGGLTRRSLAAIRRRRAGTPFLTLWRFGDELWLGPLTCAGAPGCLLCLRERLYRTSQDRTLFATQELIERGGLHTYPLPPTYRLLIDGLVGAEADRLAAGAEPLTADHALCLSLRTGELTRHPVLPVPHCPVCARARRPSRRPPAGLRAALSEGAPKVSPDEYRADSGPLPIDRWRRRFVDARTGLILNELHHESPGPVLTAEAKLVLGDRPTREPGIGRAFSWPEAEGSALLEALERHAGLETGDQPIATGTQLMLGERAIDPHSLLLHHASAYQGAGGSLTTYTPRLPTRWVWAYSFNRGARLVPEQAVTYGPLPGPRFLVESSSGCALGRSVPEAAFHALLELVERDAFLLTWHGALPVPEVALADCPDARVRSLAQHLEVQGFGVHAFRTTSDIGLPAAMLLLTVGAQPFLCAAGAHPDPIRAVLGGLLEVAAAAPDLRPAWQGYRPVGEPNPDSVRTMDDHVYFHWHPALREGWSFLLGARSPIGWREAWPESWPRHADLGQDLQELVGRLGEAELEVLIADQTPRLLRAEGLHVVRAIVPGILPLGFGYQRRRTEGAPRLLTAPARMGYGRPTALNPWPHPFG